MVSCMTTVEHEMYSYDVSNVAALNDDDDVVNGVVLVHSNSVHVTCTSVPAPLISSRRT